MQIFQGGNFRGFHRLSGNCETFTVKHFHSDNTVSFKNGGPGPDLLEFKQ